MKLMSCYSKTIYGLLEKDHKTTFQKLNRFHEVLTNLRYEGKMSIGKNLSEANRLVDYFKKEFDGHMRDEERVLFPFLQTHIPRLAPMVYLLLSEHEDFRRCLERLRKPLRAFQKNKSIKPATIDKVCDDGTYLICLLRSHIWVESHSLYKVADKELKSDEKRELIKQIITNNKRLGRGAQ